MSIIRCSRYTVMKTPNVCFVIFQCSLFIFTHVLQLLFSVVGLGGFLLYFIEFSCMGV